MPKLIFDDWKLPEVDGWPDDGEWCVVLFGEDDEPPEVFVGGYDEERKRFYANFGLGGAVLDQEDAVVWISIRDHRWESSMTEDEVELTPSYHGESCKGNGEQGE